MELCSVCGNLKDEPSKAMCGLCRKLRRIKAKTTYDGRKLRNLCPICGETSDRPGLQCHQCLVFNNNKIVYGLEIAKNIRAIAIVGDSF